jgi:hypothetical protein
MVKMTIPASCFKRCGSSQRFVARKAPEKALLVLLVLQRRRYVLHEERWVVIQSFFVALEH